MSDLASIFQAKQPTKLGAVFRSLCSASFVAAFGIKVDFPIALPSDDILVHAHAHADVSRLIKALEAEFLSGINRRSGAILKVLVFSELTSGRRLRIHLLVDNPWEHSDVQVRFAVNRSHRVVRYPDASLGEPTWHLDWHGFAASLIDVPEESLAFEFELSQFCV